MRFVVDWRICLWQVKKKKKSEKLSSHHSDNRKCFEIGPHATAGFSAANVGHCRSYIVSRPTPLANRDIYLLRDEWNILTSD